MPKSTTTPALQMVSIDNLEIEARFRHCDRWYAWQQLTPGDSRMIARFLNPNEPDGAVTNSGHIMPPGHLQVEVLANTPTAQKARLYEKLQRQRPSAIGEINSLFDG